MALDITRTDDGELTTLRLQGKLDETTAEQMRPINDAIAAEHRMHVEVDMAALELIDSSGVAKLVGLYKHVHGSGGQFWLVGATGQPREILKLLRLEKLFKP